METEGDLERGWTESIERRHHELIEALNRISDALQDLGTAAAHANRESHTVVTQRHVELLAAIAAAAEAMRDATVERAAELGLKQAREIIRQNREIDRA